MRCELGICVCAHVVTSFFSRVLSYSHTQPCEVCVACDIFRFFSDYAADYAADYAYGARGVAAADSCWI